MGGSFDPLKERLALVDASGLDLVRKPHTDRRMGARRAADREQAVFASLAAFLIARQMQPLVLIDRRLTVLLMNEAAARWFETTKHVRKVGRRLDFKSREHMACIHRVLTGEAESVCFEIKAAGSVTALRLTTQTSVTGFALLTFTRSRKGEPNEALLQDRWGLTTAECQVALGIFNGLSLVQVAKSRGASVNTVKTQARQVFQKCRVNSQVALTRSISELIAART